MNWMLLVSAGLLFVYALLPRDNTEKVMRLRVACVPTGCICLVLAVTQ